MHPQIHQLFTNNDPPSDGIAEAIQELLVTHRKELEHTDTEIRNLKIRLKVLEPKREAIQQTINDLSALISLRRLPTDVLREIFFHCLPVHRNPIMSASEAPTVLTRVCSSWRSIALSSPRLWARLHVPFCDDYLDDDKEEARLNAIKVLKLRCEVTREWLIRSGTCPLAISIHYSDSRRFRDVAELKSHGEGDLTIRFFRIIFHFKDRLQSLQLIMHENIYRCKLETMISGDGLQMLTTLKAGFYSPPSAFAGPLAHTPITLLDSPNLKSVSVFTGHWTLNTLPLTTLQRLISLSIDFVLPIDDAFSLLKNCNSLVHCLLMVMNGPLHPDITGAAYLPQLQSLQIFEEDEGEANPHFMLCFYSAIRAPHVKWINYQMEGDLEDTIDTPFPILPLLENSKELKKLTFSPRRLPDSYIRRALETQALTVTHLVLGNEPSGPSRKIWQKAGTIPEASIFRLLMIPQPRDDSAVRPQKIYLPHLEIFESALGSDISDEALFQFITSRMDPTSPAGIAKLKRVRIAFGRKKQMEVVDAVARYRDSMKMDNDEVHLELTYFSQDPVTRRVDKLSPSCGLSQGDDSSWTYLDIEESMLPED